jgi:hypothetical protein
MTPSDPYHNTYECPECSDDVSVPLPLPKFVMCPACKARLQINVDAEFYGGMWHDRTELDFADEPDPERDHMQRMINHAKRMME